MSSSSMNVSGKRARKKTLPLMSTPVSARRHVSFSTSTSAIGSKSSTSSEKGSRKKSGIIPRRKPRRPRKRADVVARKKARKKQKGTDSDTEWETRSEESVVGNANSRASPRRTSVVEQQFGSPERTRDAPVHDEYDIKRSFLPEEPIPKYRRRVLYQTVTRSFSEEDREEEDDDLFRADQLESPQVPVVRYDERSLQDYDELFAFDTRRVRKMYSPPIGKKGVIGKAAGIDKKLNWTLPSRMPTDRSDLLWDEYVKDNYDEVKEYLAHPSGKAQKCLPRRPPVAEPLHREFERNVDGFSREIDLQGETSKRTARSRKNVPGAEPTMTVTKRRYDKDSRTWVDLTESSDDSVVANDVSLETHGLGKRKFFHTTRATRIKELNKNGDSRMMPSTSRFETYNSQPPSVSDDKSKRKKPRIVRVDTSTPFSVTKLDNRWLLAKKSNM